MRLSEEPDHGRWTYAVDLAREDGWRRTRRRGGFAGRAEAAREMKAVLDGELRGVPEDRRTTVASFLREWLAARKGSRRWCVDAWVPRCRRRSTGGGLGRSVWRASSRGTTGPLLLLTSGTITPVFGNRPTWDNWNTQGTR
ncbi:hypothetical protein ACIOJE_13935 [Kitasatospora sp. NPDC087861]|uniref:hypothetical protein n=1 Tax=Kitasatospora sp. NPDC087861 TaxID=3364070 RepID=UPI0037F6774D